MNFEIFSAVASLIGALLTALLQTRAARRRGRTGPPTTFQERMHGLTTTLSRASEEVDRTLQEIAHATQERQIALSELERNVEALSASEKALQTRVDTLKNVPLPAVEYFLRETSQGERRSAFRDYFLFGAGVLVSTAITVLLKLVFGI